MEFPSYPGTVFLTGGTGKTAVQIAKLCEATKTPHIIASRSPPPSTNTSLLATYTRFDWADPTTWSPALSAAGPSSFPEIQSIFLVLPGMTDPTPTVRQFITLACSFHDKNKASPQQKLRFVLLSSSQVPEGGPAMGGVHALLRGLGDGDDDDDDEQNKIEWAVLRPTWFQENFLQLLPPRLSNNNNNNNNNQRQQQQQQQQQTFYSAAEDGRIPWVSTADIGAVGFHALTTTTNNENEYLILGPEPLSYDDVAAMFSFVLGNGNGSDRKVSHTRLSFRELADRHMATVSGLSQEYAEFLAGMDSDVIAKGGEDRTNGVVGEVLALLRERWGGGTRL